MSPTFHPTPVMDQINFSCVDGDWWCCPIFEIIPTIHQFCTLKIYKRSTSLFLYAYSLTFLFVFGYLVFTFKPKLCYHYHCRHDTR
jgi:hypothetical protein